MNSESKDRLDTKLKRECGEAFLGALNDKHCVEIMLNQDGKLWAEYHGRGIVHIGAMARSQTDAMLATVATMLGQEIHADKPILEGEFPLDGSRFEALTRPIVASPVIALRKKAAIIYTLDQYEESGIVSHREDPLNRAPQDGGKLQSWVNRDWTHTELLKNAVLLRKNIVVVGATGTGKTTFVNALIHEISTAKPQDRLVIIEDTGELQCSSPNYVQLRSAVHVPMLSCLRATMRLRPDRIIVGEVRGGEAHTLLKAWNTGHPGGILTLHANDAEAGLLRLETLIQEDTSAPRQQLIGEAVDLVVFIGKEPNLAAGRKLRQVVEVQGFNAVAGSYITQHH
jgi:type IV secretion system protein VirB11